MAETTVCQFGINRLIEIGGYRKLDSRISDQYAPIYRRPNSEEEVEYLDLDDCGSSEIALRRMEKRGYRPAEDLEVLRYCNRHPERPVSGNPIVVLGSVWQFLLYGDCLVLVLNRDSGARYVNLDWWDCVWDESFRFAAVKS